MYEMCYINKTVLTRRREFCAYGQNHITSNRDVVVGDLFVERNPEEHVSVQNLTYLLSSECVCVSVHPLSEKPDFA